MDLTKSYDCVKYRILGRTMSSDNEEAPIERNVDEEPEIEVSEEQTGDNVGRRQGEKSN